MSAHDWIIPRTPSAFHSERRAMMKKHPSHDKMQQEVLAFLRGRVLAGVGRGAYVDRTVEGEYPIVRRGQIVAYIDAIEIISINLIREVNLFEIKPEIDTVFGIIRQAKAQLQLARSSIEAERHYCHVVVPAEDPLLLELRAEWPHTWAWGFKVPVDDEGDDE